MLPEWIKTPLTDYLELLKREGWCQSTIAMQKSSNMRFCNYLVQRDLGNNCEWLFPGKHPTEHIPKTSVDRKFNEFWNATKAAEMVDRKPTVL